MNLAVLIPDGPVTDKRPCGTRSAEHGACHKKNMQHSSWFFSVQTLIVKLLFYVIQDADSLVKDGLKWITVHNRLNVQSVVS